MNDPQDTGARLRSLYEPQGGVGRIFSAKVADYAASRPDYPAALFDTLRAEGALPPASHVADIGAGTGLLTQGFLARGHRVTAVEPSAEMREACDALLGHHADYRSVAGQAEATGLPDGSVDLITAAQAFHWFDIEPARREALRVLKAHGQVALVWNDRVFDDPLHVALDEVFAEFGGERRGALVAHEDRREVASFYGFQPPELHFPHAHALDVEGFKSLAFSRSYMPARDTEAGARASAALEALFQRFAQDARVAVRYTTVLMLGRPAG
jgi:SAM-dependent methyltransferase